MGFRFLHTAPVRPFLLAPKPILPFVVVTLVFLGLACSSGNGNEQQIDETPGGSGQIPVENPDGAGRPDSPILSGDARRGLDSYVANGCSTCHSGENPDLGPDHANLLETAGSKVEGLSAVDYIAQSIREPDAFVVPGFESPSIMPDFSELTEDEIQNLITYMRTFATDTGPPQLSVDSLPAGVVEEGRRLYGSIGCSGCHSLGSDRIVGPGFRGVADRAGVRRAGLTAEEYIVESIREPAIFIVEGFPRQMPAYDELSAQEIANLLAFLKSLD